MKILVAAVVGHAILAQAAPELDLLERASQLDSPALLLAFIFLLYRGKLRWERDVVERDRAIEAWQEAAGIRVREKERDATIAEAALRAGRR